MKKENGFLAVLSILIIAFIGRLCILWFLGWAICEVFGLNYSWWQIVLGMVLINFLWSMISDKSKKN